MVESPAVATGAAVLGQFELCRDARFDAFRDSLNGVFYPAEVVPTGRETGGARSRLAATRLSHLTLGFVRFGTETSLDPGALGYYHVNVPLSGAVESACGDRTIVARPGLAAVFTPREHTVLPRWGADAGQLCIKIERRSLERELEAMLGRPVGGEVRLDLGFDLTTPVGRSWVSVLRVLLHELDEEQSLVRRSPDHREAFERLLIATLLRSHHHEFSDALSADHPPVRSRTVKRVVDAVGAAPERAWTVTDLAEVAGVGARRLQQGFREQMGMGPMAYLRVVRLERVRADLVDGLGPVTEAASRWGFAHLGRFAEAYRLRFGESPSRTLRRA